MAMESEKNLINIFSDNMSGIPAPIKKNAFKAFAQLCTAAIELPTAYFEGKAAEKRAETQARIKIINTGAEQIARQMQVNPEYADAAVKKFGQRIIQDQINIDIIAKNAADDLLNTPEENNNTNEDVAVDEISSDWLNAFEKEACNKSSDEMRLLFGKILAGEIRKPKSFSIKTIKLISQLDNQAASIFQNYCSLCISLCRNSTVFDARVATLDGIAEKNSLIEYGLSFYNLNILNEYGLIISQYNSILDYQICIMHEQNKNASSFVYQGKKFILVPMNNSNYNPKLELGGVELTLSGKELLNIIDILPCEKYTTALTSYFLKKNLQMIEVKNFNISSNRIA